MMDTFYSTQNFGNTETGTNGRKLSSWSSRKILNFRHVNHSTTDENQIQIHSKKFPNNWVHFMKFSSFPEILDNADTIDLFTNTAAILDSLVSDIYYGMLRGQIHTNLPPEHPIITIWNNRIQNGRRIGRKVYYQWKFPRKYKPD